MLVSIISLSFLGYVIPAKSVDRIAWVSKEGEYQFLAWWISAWTLTLYIETNRAWYSACGHYYFSSNDENYVAGFGSLGWSWVKYSEDSDYFYCPICHRLILVSYEVHGRFYFTTDSSNYYDLTLAIELNSDDTYETTFGPFYNHLVGTWRFYEDDGLES